MSFPTIKVPTPSGKNITCTDPDIFEAAWEQCIPTLSVDELKLYLSQTSPIHPNPNMAWLHARIQGELWWTHRIAAA